jgi:hypothetical protein
MGVWRQLSSRYVHVLYCRPYVEHVHIVWLLPLLLCAADLAGDSFSCKTWWSTVAKNPSAAVLAELAGVLLDVVPHAAGPERVFSQMGWFEGSTSSSLATSTTAKKVAIKMHYDAVAPPRKRE